MTPSRKILPFCLFLAVTVSFLSLFFYLSAQSVDNYWMVRAFDVDESGVLADIHYMFEKHRWEPLNYIYGTAHTYISLVLINLWSISNTVDFVDICVLSRLVNALSLLGIGALLFRELGSNTPLKWKFLFLCLLLFSGLNFSYSINSKPELLQAFFVVSALVMFRRYLQKDSGWLLFGAGMLTGMAFATKYAGVLLLGFLSVFLVAATSSRKSGRSIISTTGKGLITLYVGAICGVAVLGPFILRDFGIVYQVLGTHSTIIRKGFIFLQESNGLDWIPTMFSQKGLWWGLVILAVPGLALVLSQRKRRELTSPPLYASWVLFYVIYLVFMVNEINSRYLVIVLPFCFLLVVACLSRFGEWLKERQKVAGGVFYAISLLLVLYVTVNGTTPIMNQILSKPTSPRIVAGEWLSLNVDTKSVVASDLYTYVPPEFRRHFHQTYLKAYDIIKVRPDYLVVSSAIMSRYLDINKADVYREGKDAFLRHYYLYSKLKNDSFNGYKMLKSFEDVIIFERKKV